MGLLAKIFGTKNDKIIKNIRPIVQRINELEPNMRKLSDDELKALTGHYRLRFEKGEPLDQILPEAYATCREGARRTLGQRHYDVQLIGGIVLHQGKISEMRTGEGKTLTATLPAYLHGLTGLGAHVITVNDYLAKRDAEWMGKVYASLGLTTGTIVHGLRDNQRQASYGADITYGTNNEFGFDYLRDNMKTDPSRLVQRGHHFAIVDEVDSILIDEARTPLIISGPSETNTKLYEKVNGVIPGIKKDVDYTVDEKSRVVALTEDGISKMEKRLGLDNIYDPKNVEWLHHIQQALKAHVLFKKDVDYVVRGGEVIIVDEFTGRLMPGRRYSDGLHGALEAKEHVAVQNETQTLATITFQNYFRLYDVLSGMTGTADTEAVEFKKIYNLDVVVIPTNKQNIRKDEDDVIYRTAREKFTAIAEEIKTSVEKGQPVLVGTVSVEKSELLSQLLQKMNIPHQVLNAKNHASEASIIENAGHTAHVTIATNMAGRGTDIVLGEGVKEKGGLYVIGTERHESRRIDNQLRGRSGRQGDPGRTKFFLSLEDDLMRIFASDRLSAIMERLGMTEGESIVSPMVTRAIEKAQRRVEEQNFSSRKNLLEYDDVMSQQRQVIYKQRKDALFSHADVTLFMKDTVKQIVSSCLERFTPEATNQEHWNLEGARLELSKELAMDLSLPKSSNSSSPDMLSLTDAFIEQVLKHYEDKLAFLGKENQTKLESYIFLQIIDQCWKEHLLAMDALKDSVSLRGYGQRDPLQEYKKEAFRLFDQLMNRVDQETAMILLRMPKPSLVEKDAIEAEGFNQEDDEGETVEEERFVPQRATEQPTRQPIQGKTEREDDLIYHGSHAALQEQTKEKAAAPLKREMEKIGRNDPCPCGSGKKYKKCHGSDLS